MRIFIQSPNVSGSIDGSLRTAHRLLHSSAITSARPGGIINDQGNARGVILIEPCDVTMALSLLKKAGIRAALE
jgi:hypothetical protein